MKKKIILLPLLVLALTSCDSLNLNDLLGGGNNNNGNQQTTSRERSSLDPNDVAIKIADMVSVFPEVGDKVDLSEYISFDEGFEHALNEYTFTSSNPEAITIDMQNYKANCVGEGYTGITVSGPGINTPVTISFYVGSIAGNYTPESKALDGVVSLNLAKGEEGYSFELKVVDNGKEYNKRPNTSFEGAGAVEKNISPFLPFDFDGAEPTTFEPVTSYLSALIPDMSQFQDLTQDIYGYMVADSEYGVLIKMRYNNTFITLGVY